MAILDSGRWCDICGPKRGFGDHHTDRHQDYEFREGELLLPNGDYLVRVRRQGDTLPYISGSYKLLGPKRGIRHAAVELWVHGARARDEDQFLSFLNGDSHDQSKCQVLAHKLHGSRFYNVT